MQQRNLRNEIMIAVGAVLIIGFGLLFAVLLTGNPEDGTATPIAQVSSPTVPADETEATTDAMTATELATEASSEEAASTESVTATEVTSASPEPSATTAATNTDEASPTVAASATDLPTSTDKPTESSTASATNEISATTALSTTGRLATTAAATATNAAPIATERASATNEPNASADASPTTRNIGRATRSVTATIESSATVEPSATATNTRRPSATPTNTPSPTRTTRPSSTPSPTLTPRPSATPTSQNAMTGIIPTPPPSPTVPPLNLPSRTPSSCQLPQGWTTYTVLSGNTLFAIALATNSTVDELRTANCIENIDNIQTGDVVFVPRAPLNPVATFVNTGSRAGLGPIGCQSPNVQITSPISNQRLNGTFTVYGTAIRSDFLYYKIEVRPDAASIYNFYSDSRTQVTNGILGEINSELFGSGLHWLKLTLVDLSASIPADATCEIPVIFE